ncbi:hypothetical protein cypCar_00027847 [Cyprinus carpio]|nr:hypothetical protein cypCar_00027847 [Cyprinus carpio]
MSPLKRQKKELKDRLEKFTPSIPDVTNVKILVAGQIGAGKSSFINSVLSVFQEEIANEALAEDLRSADSHSFTKRFGEKSLTSDDEHYNQNPSLSDQAFCLVYVIDGSTVQLAADDKIITEKLRLIRQTISDKGKNFYDFYLSYAQHLIVMSKVDEACPLVKNDLKKVYRSKKIKEKMELCSFKVGVPMSNIFPVKNYHNEINTNDHVDVLILKALDQIVRSADARQRFGASNK